MSYVTVQHRCKGKGRTNVLNRLSSFECSIFWTWKDSQILSLDHIQTACPAHHHHHQHQHAWSDIPHNALLVQADANISISQWLSLCIVFCLSSFLSLSPPSINRLSIRERQGGRQGERKGERKVDMGRGRGRVPHVPPGARFAQS